MSKKAPEICKCGARLHTMKKHRRGQRRVYWCSGCDRTRVVWEIPTWKKYLEMEKGLGGE